MIMRRFASVFAVVVLGGGAALTARAQSAPQPAETSEKPPDVFAGLKFRDLGPASAGGRVAAVAGVPGDPNVYYVGAGGGGIFKSEDGGLTFHPIFEHEKTSSIGAIAISPSNPSNIWVGTGEGNVRNDVIDGAGVYFSPDAGHSWKYMGLAGTRQISSIAIDPADPNTVFVGALGHAWAPNPDRGVYKTTDGGKTWRKVLFVNDQTGVADLQMAPGNGKVLFAAMWQFRRYPWTLEDGGPASGIYRSTDGGETWQKVSKGLPEGPLGRIALGIAPTNPQHVYALIAAKEGMLWQSLDMGDSWSAVSDNHALDVRPFYFSKVIVSPENENKVYFLSFNVMESDDGGKTAHVASRVHSDHHAMWIDPRDPKRIIEGGDGGVYLTLDGAKTWQFLARLPIEQFYQLAADWRRPYFLCGGLQDNSAWCGPSSDMSRPGVTGASWYTVTGGDGEYSVPAPSDPNIVYSDAQNGDISRLDLATHISRAIRPYLEGVEEVKPADLKYRFNWTAPIAVSPTNANEIYLGANAVFKSSDGGKTWSPISGDLTRDDKSKQEIAGGPVQHDISGAETYGTIMAITLAPTDPGVIWVGTDDGLVQLTRDGGKTWTNVTLHIPGAPQWARVYQIGVSPFGAGTAYAAFDGHMLDDRQPYVYRTSDYGATWTKITGGLPEDSPVHVVREDPNQRGFLAAGTDSGLWFSRDSGAHWQQLKSNFPTVPVYDLKFPHGTHDLAVATHGRGVFVLDDIRPLEEFSAPAEPNAAKSAFQLFSPAPGMILHHWRLSEGEERGYSAPNAPEGVILDYYLPTELKPSPEQKRQHESPVKIVVATPGGEPVNTLYGPSEAGINRFIWNLRFSGPVLLKAAQRAEPPPGLPPEFNRSFGPLVPPGTYKISVTVNGHTETRSAEVLADPNLRADPAVFREQTRAALEARNQATAMDEMLNRIADMQKTIADFAATVETSQDEDLKKKYEPLVTRGRALSKKLAGIKDAFLSPAVQLGAPEDDIHELLRLQPQISSLRGDVTGSYGEPPRPLAIERAHELYAQLAQQLKAFNDLLKSDVAAYNKAAAEAGAPTVFAGEPISVKAAGKF